MSSSTSSTSSTSSSAPSSSSTPSNGAQGSSSLYLFTFLATLFLLLCISCGIILRSVVLRRRFRRRIDEALAAGVILTPHERRVAGRGRRRELGEKPRFYEAWVVGGESVLWEDIQPVSVQKTSTKKSHLYSSNFNSSTPPVPSRLRTLFARSRSSPASPASSPPPSTPTTAEQPPAKAAEELQVSVLVAMPVPPHIKYKMGGGAKKAREVEESEEDVDVDGGGEEVPDVELGVVKLTYGA